MSYHISFGPLCRAAIIAVITASAAPAVIAEDGEPALLTLDQCITIALTDNPTVRVADMEVAKADYSRRETLGQLLPSVSFSGTYNRTLQKQVAYMNMDAFAGMGGGAEDGETPPEDERPSGGDQGIKMGLDNMYSLGFSA